MERAEVSDLVDAFLVPKKRINAKAKGNRQEARSIRLLEAAGYACSRSAASLGVFDIIGISATDIVLCQVKSNAWPRSEEMEAIRLFACPPNARKLIHRWRDGQRFPDVKEVP
jgi:Holliday junction resolvase